MSSKNPPSSKTPPKPSAPGGTARKVHYIKNSKDTRQGPPKPPKKS